MLFFLLWVVVFTLYSLSFSLKLSCHHCSSFIGLSVSVIVRKQLSGDVAAAGTKLSFHIVSSSPLLSRIDQWNTRHSSPTISNWWKTATTLHLFRESPASVLPHKHAHEHILTHTELLKGALLWPLCIARREQTVAFHQCLMGRWKGHRYLLYLAYLFVSV